MDFNEIRRAANSQAIDYSVRTTLEQMQAEAMATGFPYVDPIHALMVMANISPSTLLRRRLQDVVFFKLDQTRGLASDVPHEVLSAFVSDLSKNADVLSTRSQIALSQMFNRMKWLAARRSPQAPIARGDLAIAAFANHSPLMQEFLDRYGLDRVDILITLGAPDSIVLEYFEVGLPTP